MNSTFARVSRIALPALVAALLVACGSSPRQPAPVENRGSARQSAPSAVDPKSLPGAENAGKPGYYTVQKGDTLMRIALDQGQAWRDLVRWNNLPNPDLIEVGQVLRVVSPGATVEASGVVVRPVTGSAAAATAASEPPTPAKAPAAASSASGTAAAGEELSFSWPASGQVIASFDEAKNKGIDIAGKPGDPVLAAADGQVVYAGAGLRGYGNLIIVKHNNTFLTAYAHNQKLLVKEDQKVSRGERIAEMGNTDADRVKLHFEVRRQGKPVDPARFLVMR
jgi:lipoprotein NlpD